MDKDNEIWRDVLNYEGFYQVSNLGNIRSLDRVISYSNGRRQFYKGRRMSCNLKPNGYRYITLSKNQIQRCTTVAQVVAVAFLGHKPDGYTLVVDHINGVKTDDRASNLRIVTNRENNSSCYRSDRKSLSSSFTGVYWKANASKWASQIKHKGVNYYLGCFDNENDAADCYQEALLKIKDKSFNPSEYKPKFSSKYKGVTFNKASNKWMTRITISGKITYIGIFPTEVEAHHAYLKAINESNAIIREKCDVRLEDLK